MVTGKATPQEVYQKVADAAQFLAKSGEKGDSEVVTFALPIPAVASLFIPVFSTPGPKESSGLRIESWIGASIFLLS
jgi:hypothetical protein